MRIYIAGDHAGFRLKGKIKLWLEGLGYKVDDLGPFEYKKGDDYPDYTFPLAEAVSFGKKSFGIVIAGSGIGECIAANKVRGVRAVLYHGGSLGIIKTSRLHDDANVLCLGARFVGEGEARRAIKLWLKTKFSNAKRHKRRLSKIASYEK